MRKFKNIKLMNFENNIFAQIKHGAYTSQWLRSTCHRMFVYKS